MTASMGGAVLGVFEEDEHQPLRTRRAARQPRQREELAHRRILLEHLVDLGLIGPHLLGRTAFLRRGRPRG